MSLSYEELKREIDAAPESHVPGLLIAVVRTAIKRQVFQPGGLEKVVARTIESES